MIIALGSTSSHKVAALMDALAAAEVRADIVQYPTVSGVGEQPISAQEATCGAFKRATTAMLNSQATGFRVSYSVGVESGIEERGGVWLDIATVVILKPTLEGPELAALTTSVGVPMPKQYVDECLDAGPCTHTVGEFYAAARGGDKTDITTTLSGSKLTRQGLLADAIYAALVMAGITGEA